MAKTKRHVTHLSQDAEVAQAFAKNAPGADRRVLERVAEAAALGNVVVGQQEGTRKRALPSRAWKWRTAISNG